MAVGNQLVWDTKEGEDNECVGTQTECDRVYAELITTRIHHTVDSLGENVGISGVYEGGGGSYNLMRVLVVNRLSPQDDAVYSGGTRSVTLIDDWNTPPGHHPGVVEHEVTHDFFYKHMHSVIQGDETQGIAEGISIIMQATTEPPIAIRAPEQMTGRKRSRKTRTKRECISTTHTSGWRPERAMPPQQGRHSWTQYATSKMSTTTWMLVLGSFWGRYLDRSVPSTS